MSAEPWVLWIAGGLAFVLVALGMLPAIRAWNALGRRDREVSLRKVHTKEIPRVGGFVLMAGFAVVAIRGLAGTTELSAALETPAKVLLLLAHLLTQRTPLHRDRDVGVVQGDGLSVGV